MVNVFIDESGNLGQGGEFFTIAAVAFSNPKGEARLKRLMKKCCLHFSPNGDPLKELEANDLSFPHKQAILQKMASRADMKYFILLHKSSMLHYCTNKKIKTLCTTT